MAVSQPDFDLVFASGAADGELSEMPESAYLRGWGYLNVAEPVPRTYFNYLQYLLDLRLTYLFAAERIRKDSTEYAIGEAVRSPGLSSAYVLLCTAAGTTASAEPELGSAAEGDTVTDGSCTWAVRRYLERELALAADEPTGQLEGDIWIEEE